MLADKADCDDDLLKNGPERLYHGNAIGRLNPGALQLVVNTGSSYEARSRREAWCITRTLT